MKTIKHEIGNQLFLSVWTDFSQKLIDVRVLSPMNDNKWFVSENEPQKFEDMKVFEDFEEAKKYAYSVFKEVGTSLIQQIQEQLDLVEGA